MPSSTSCLDGSAGDYAALEPGLQQFHEHLLFPRRRPPREHGLKHIGHQLLDRLLFKTQFRERMIIRQASDASGRDPVGQRQRLEDGGQLLTYADGVWAAVAPTKSQ